MGIELGSPDRMPRRLRANAGSPSQICEGDPSDYCN